jgi:electron transport complex protein RnfD
MSRRFATAGAPHLGPDLTVTTVMARVIIALVPGTALYAWWFGPGILVHMALATATALAVEAACVAARGRPVTRTLLDLSAVVTALLLALAIPPLAPWWVTVTATAMAMVFGKHVYGGLGMNPFNPAMVGYVVALISFPREMTTWAAPVAGDWPLSLGASAALIFGAAPTLTLDAVSAATPLDSLRTVLAAGGDATALGALAPTVYGPFGGPGWGVVGLGFAAGGLWMLWNRTIRWQIPVSFLVTLSGLALLFWLMDPTRHADPLWQLGAGATLLGAFFIATDPVTAATSPRGRLIYGAGAGALVFIIRTWGGYPDGVAFAVLLMNAAAPFIDRYTVPRIYGHAR